MLEAKKRTNIVHDMMMLVLNNTILLMGVRTNLLKQCVMRRHQSVYCRRMELMSTIRSKYFDSSLMQTVNHRSKAL